jgi:hypothetical protein
MRMHRTLSGLIVTALLGAAPLGIATSADASESVAVQRQAVSQAAAGDKPKHKVTSNVIEPKRNKLILKGKVSPNYGKKPVLIQKKNCDRKSCKWHKFAKVKTNRKGQFRSRITAPRNGRDYWRAKVAPSRRYAVSYSAVYYTYTL